VSLATANSQHSECIGESTPSICTDVTQLLNFACRTHSSIRDGVADGDLMGSISGEAKVRRHQRPTHGGLSYRDGLSMLTGADILGSSAG
jgi:hypothetical protein